MCCSEVLEGRMRKRVKLTICIQSYNVNAILDIFWLGWFAAKATFNTTKTNAFFKGNNKCVHLSVFTSGELKTSHTFCLLK